jgi:tRNA G18 (ribose-2'-O)-methylase SpoU
MAVVNGGTNVLELEPKRPMCLVIGNEEVGITPTVQKYGIKITLPQRQPDISYNASVAAGILMFTLANR